jgi:hypothetical protein
MLAATSQLADDTDLEKSGRKAARTLANMLQFRHQAFHDWVSKDDNLDDYRYPAAEWLIAAEQNLHLAGTRRSR